LIPVISKANWNRWCVKNSIDLSDAEFALDGLPSLPIYSEIAGEDAAVIRCYTGV
jgi:hypothetical protein